VSDRPLIASSFGSDAPIASGRLPAGLRVYAVGDLHGRFDLLEALYSKLRDDLAAAPPERSVEIFIGDYVDRGPRSREVVAWLAASEPACDERICLMGNHEDLLIGALADTAGMEPWLMNGGVETLLSYCGMDRSALETMSLVEAREAFRAALPGSHREFLRGLRRMAVLGGYAFVHAGLDPSRPLGDQDPSDLLWIRQPFLSSGVDFGKVVVHGHTPARDPEIRPNRINIDTGAFYTGRLTCLVLEDDARRFFQAAEESAGLPPPRLPR
jgi:serine/threonine protein phosphatase 1